MGKVFFSPQRHSELSLFQGSGGELRKQLTAPTLCVYESGHAGQHTAELDQNQLIPVTHNLFTLIIIIWHRHSNKVLVLRYCCYNYDAILCYYRGGMWLRR